MLTLHRNLDSLYATNIEDMSISEVLELFETNNELSHIFWDSSGRFYCFATRAMLESGYYHYCDTKTNHTQERWFS
jgi:hypothetical protein